MSSRLHESLLRPFTSLAAVALAAFACPGVDAAQAESAFTVEQLEQMVAPIALHPDSLLTQILMASTYPLEIVEAQRWVQKDPKRTGKALEEALKKEDWDPSVKSICGFPTVLAQMNDNLDWTQDLGDAFLGQKAELLDAVQRMRQKALESGNLKSTEQQTVTEDGKIIIIQSASPEVIYVPTYSPTVVYGSWYYPTWYYPPMYYPPPPGYGAMAFTAGVIWGAAVWGNCNWHGGDIDIDINHYNEFNKNTNINAERTNIQNNSGNKTQWNHDPEHRKGVNYKSPQTAQKYGSAPGSSRVTKDQARGYDRAAPSQTGNRASTATRNTGSRPSSSTPSAASKRPTTGSPSSRASGGGSAFSGSRSSSFDRSASTRGAASRGGSASRGGGRRR